MDDLTVEQREFWDEIGFKPLEDPDDAETLGYRISGIQQAFQFDGYPVPSRDAIRAEFARRAGHGELAAEGGGGEGYLDLPFESGSADPEPLRYKDLGPGKKYRPDEDFRDAQRRSQKGDGDG